MYLLNSILATLLLLSLFLPYISPKTIPIIAIISLIVPFLIAFNLLFVLYWILQTKKQFLLSATVVLIFWLFSPPIYKFSKAKNQQKSELSLMSYNVRMFNRWQWKNEAEIPEKILNFIEQEQPDILLIQEYFKSDSIVIDFPYKYVKTKKNKDKVGLAIFSKYKIINQGSLDFKETSNNVIYTDILKEKDTIRVYNIHLQSLQINPLKFNFGEQNSTKLISRLKNGFSKQAAQAEDLIKHEQKWKGKKIIAGDFNNTSYSWVYNQLSNNKKDAFLEAGSGFGKTFDYQFPLRIDFILTDNKANIHYYKSEKVKYSDHFPIQASICW